MEIPSDLLYAMKEIIRRAIMTLGVLRDPDARYMGWARLPLPIIHDVQEAYGYSSASVRRFQPTPYEIDQMEIVMPWLAWLRREEGKREFSRLWRWAVGVPVWRLGLEENCTERTIRNKIDRSVCSMIREFVGVDAVVEPIFETAKKTDFSFRLEVPFKSDGIAEIKRVYVGGTGYMKGGRRLRRGDERLNVA